MADGGFPADGGDDLTDESLSDAVGRSMGMGGDVGYDRHSGRDDRNFVQGGGELRERAGHEGGMVRASYREGNGFFGAFGFGEFAGGRQFIGRAGDHDLSRAIQIRQLDTSFFAKVLRSWFVEANDRGHAAFGFVAGLLHELPALAH